MADPVSTRESRLDFAELADRIHDVEATLEVCSAAAADTSEDRRQAIARMLDNALLTLHDGDEIRLVLERRFAGARQ